MFLRQDNSIKWKKLAIASVVVVFLCLAGVIWFDKPLFLFLRNFNWSVWGFFDTVFTTKIWLVAAFFTALVIVFIKNTVMFLKQDNSIKWKKLAVTSFVVVFLCFVGVFFDKLFFLFLHNVNWSVWGFFDTVFTTKIWLAVAFCVALVIVIKNAVKSKHKVTKDKNKFSIKKIINKFKEKSKNNFGFLVLCSVFLAGLITDILKYGFGRQRPIFFEALGQSGFYPMNNDWAFNSMPSGHSSASFAALVMIGLLFPKIKWATWTLAIVIGVSRVCYGDHWPSDVIFGAFIGMVVADIVKSIFFKNK